MTSILADPLWNRISAREQEIVASYVASRPVRVAALATALGLTVVKVPMKPNISGLIQPADVNNSAATSGFEIQVNKYDTPERQRFTVAHELGHFLLHRDRIGAGVTDTILFRSQLSSNIEIEANKIAADIVMPVNLVKSDLASFNNEKTMEIVKLLAETYRVSEPAMRIRLGI